MKQLIATLLIALMVAPTAAIADTATERDKTKKGAVIGGIAGGIVGAVVGNKKRGNPRRGAVVGVVAGTAAGAIVGAMMDKQERELRQIEGINVSRTADDELRVSVKNEVLFDYDSAALRSESRSAIREMADVFQKYPDTTLVVAGHTDSTGSASYNQRLSERRASSVANYLEGLGIRSSRVDAVGYGESSPRSSNNTASGRQMNRRVEISIRANA